MKQQMVKVSVEVRSGAARFRVGVQAPSIREALSLVGGRCPQRELRVVSPIRAEGFLVREPLASGRVICHEQSYQAAA